jgi:nucleoside 2-deoxyribosyltransferase
MATADEVRHLRARRPDVVVANMDGADPDSGTCWESGYARRKKSIIVFRTDFRVGYEIRGDAHPAEQHDRVPYSLVLTESADVQLDLPFKSVEDVRRLCEHQP